MSASMKQEEEEGLEFEIELEQVCGWLARSERKHADDLMSVDWTLNMRQKCSRFFNSTAVPPPHYAIPANWHHPKIAPELPRAKATREEQKIQEKHQNREEFNFNLNSFNFNEGSQMEAAEFAAKMMEHQSDNLSALSASSSLLSQLLNSSLNQLIGLDNGGSSAPSERSGSRSLPAGEEAAGQLRRPSARLEVDERDLLLVPASSGWSRTGAGERRLRRAPARPATGVRHLPATNSFTRATSGGQSSERREQNRDKEQFVAARELEFVPAPKEDDLEKLRDPDSPRSLGWRRPVEVERTCDKQEPAWRPSTNACGLPEGRPAGGGSECWATFCPHLRPLIGEAATGVRPEEDSLLCSVSLAGSLADQEALIMQQVSPARLSSGDLNEREKLEERKSQLHPLPDKSLECCPFCALAGPATGAESESGLLSGNSRQLQEATATTCYELQNGSPINLRLFEGDRAEGAAAIRRSQQLEAKSSISSNSTSSSLSSSSSCGIRVTNSDTSSSSPAEHFGPSNWRRSKLIASEKSSKTASEKLNQSDAFNGPQDQVKLETLSQSCQEELCEAFKCCLRVGSSSERIPEFEPKESAAWLKGLQAEGCFLRLGPAAASKLELEELGNLQTLALPARILQRAPLDQLAELEEVELEEELERAGSAPRPPPSSSIFELDPRALPAAGREDQLERSSMIEATASLARVVSGESSCASSRASRRLPRRCSRILELGAEEPIYDVPSLSPRPLEPPALRCLSPDQKYPASGAPPPAEQELGATSGRAKLIAGSRDQPAGGCKCHQCAQLNALRFLLSARLPPQNNQDKLPDKQAKPNLSRARSHLPRGRLTEQQAAAGEVSLASQLALDGSGEFLELARRHSRPGRRLSLSGGRFEPASSATSLLSSSTDSSSNLAECSCCSSPSARSSRRKRKEAVQASEASNGCCSSCSLCSPELSSSRGEPEEEASSSSELRLRGRGRSGRRAAGSSSPGSLTEEYLRRHRASSRRLRRTRRRLQRRLVYFGAARSRSHGRHARVLAGDEPGNGFERGQAEWAGPRGPTDAGQPTESALFSLKGEKQIAQPERVDKRKSSPSCSAAAKFGGHDLLVWRLINGRHASRVPPASSGTAPPAPETQEALRRRETCSPASKARKLPLAGSSAELLESIGRDGRSPQDNRNNLSGPAGQQVPKVAKGKEGLMAEASLRHLHIINSVKSGLHTEADGARRHQLNAATALDLAHGSRQETANDCADSNDKKSPGRNQRRPAESSERRVRGGSRRGSRPAGGRPYRERDSTVGSGNLAANYEDVYGEQQLLVDQLQQLLGLKHNPRSSTGRHNNPSRSHANDIPSHQQLSAEFRRRGETGGKLASDSKSQQLRRALGGRPATRKHHHHHHSSRRRRSHSRVSRSLSRRRRAPTCCASLLTTSATCSCRGRCHRRRASSHRHKNHAPYKGRRPFHFARDLAKSGHLGRSMLAEEEQEGERIRRQRKRLIRALRRKQQELERAAFLKQLGLKLANEYKLGGRHLSPVLEQAELQEQRKHFHRNQEIANLDRMQLARSRRQRTVQFPFVGRRRSSRVLSGTSITSYSSSLRAKLRARRHRRGHSSSTMAQMRAMHKALIKSPLQLKSLSRSSSSRLRNKASLREPNREEVFMNRFLVKSFGAQEGFQSGGRSELFGRQLARRCQCAHCCLLEKLIKMDSEAKRLKRRLKKDE